MKKRILYFLRMFYSVMMDWKFIENVFGFDADSVGQRADEILDVFGYLEKELGLDWLQGVYQYPVGKYAIETILEYANCLKVTDLIINGRILKKKLLSDFHS